MPSTNAIFDPNIFDGPDMFDTRQKNFTVTINDEGGNVTDSISRLAKYFRTFTEGGKPIFDGAIFDENIFDTGASGSGRITDSITSIRGAKISLNEAAITIGDSLARKLGAVRTFTENTPISESLARLAKYFRSIIDSGQGIFDGPDMFDPNIFDVDVGGIQVSDTVAALRGAVVSISENTAISETLARKLKAFVTLSESTIITESLARKLGSFRSLSDTTTISETLARKLKAFRTFSESNAISDAIASTRGAFVSFVETTTISETLARLTKQFRTFSESSAVTDSVAAFKVVGRRIKQAFAWINKKSTKAFIFKRKTSANANKRKTNARV